MIFLRHLIINNNNNINNKNVKKSQSEIQKLENNFHGPWIFWSYIIIVLFGLSTLRKLFECNVYLNFSQRFHTYYIWWEISCNQTECCHLFRRVIRPRPNRLSSRLPSETGKQYACAYVMKSRNYIMSHKAGEINGC